MPPDQPRHHFGHPQAPALADTSNYCGVVATGSGDGKVATGYWCTAENGRRYCRQIVDSANYVCMARR